MPRRIAALLGIAIIVGLMLGLMWRVYKHHERTADEEETLIVALDARPLLIRK